MKDYDFGVNRVWYKTTGFAEGVTVTGRFYRPDGTSVDSTNFEEHGDGVYSLLFDFRMYGRWFLQMFEDGIPTCACIKRVGF